MALGNAKADSVAPGLASSSSDSTKHMLFLTPSYQPCYQSKERDKLIKGGAQKKDGWFYLNNRLILPQDLAFSIISDIHQTLRVGPKALFHFLEPLFLALYISKIILHRFTPPARLVPR